MRTHARRVRQRLESGGRAFGVTVQLPSPDIIEIAGTAGLDFAWVDAEHGTMGIGEINNLVRAADAAGIDAIVRLPNSEASLIQRVLDTGAAGIIVPHITTLDQARTVVRSAKFGPEGTRGACPSTRWVGHASADWANDARRANSDVWVFGLIEDPEGVDNVEDIAHSSGMDGLVLGPFDLSQSLGLSGDVGHKEIEAIHERVVAAVKAAEIEYISIPGWEFGDYAKVAEYSRIFNISNDRLALVAALRKSLKRATDGLASAEGRN